MLKWIPLWDFDPTDTWVDGEIKFPVGETGVCDAITLDEVVPGEDFGTIVHINDNFIVTKGADGWIVIIDGKITIDKVIQAMSEALS